MAVPRELITLFLNDLAQAAETSFSFNIACPTDLWTHSPTGWLLCFKEKSRNNTRYLHFELQRDQRVHAIVVHAGDEEYTIFQGATLRTLLAYAVGQLLLDQDPRLQLFRFELRRGTEFLEDVTAKAKESVQASD